MAIKCFVDALKKPTKVEYEGADRIPGTDIIRTYCANDTLYSKQSDLNTIISNENRARGMSKEC